MIELLNQDKISFTSQYDNKKYLTVFDIDEEMFRKQKEKISKELKKKKLDENEFERQLSEKIKEIQSVKTKMIKLDWMDEIALANIDALKEELVNMVRKKRDSYKDSFELAPEKANKMHDDRAYVCAMAGYGLMEERRKAITQRKKVPKKNLVGQLTIRRGKEISSL